MTSYAVVGLGNIAKRHRKNLKIINPNAKIIAVSATERKVNTSIENADIVCQKIGEVEHLKPKFVIVASPASLHIKHALYFLQRNIPVLIEKPVTTDLEKLKPLLALLETNSTPVTVGYCLRYLKSFHEVKATLNTRRLGKIYNVIVNVGQYLPSWRPEQDLKNTVSARKDLGGGVLLELSHEFDYLQALLGTLEVEYAILRNTEELALDVEEIADIVLTNEQGIVINVHLDFFQKPASRTCRVMGEKGTLEWDLIRGCVEIRCESETESINDADFNSNDMYLSMLRDFQSCISGEENTCVKVLEAADTLKVINQIHRNANRRTKL